MTDKNVDPASYTEFADEEHTVQCFWWFNDRKYEGWFKPEELEPAEDNPSAPTSS